jgi:fluoroacetyl-CoA thioesterase
MTGPADSLDLPQPRRGGGEAGPLEPGSERTDEFEVTGPLLTDVGGTIGVAVLSTPGMIGMMERTCAVLAYESLPEGSATVGFEVCIKHVSGAVEGAVCTGWAKLTEIVDDRKLFFDVEVKEGDRTIGVGTHQRRVIRVPEARG